MLPRLLLSFLLFLYSICFSFGHSGYEKFKTAFAKKDTVATQAALTEWEKSNPNDPELYTSAFNFYYEISKKEILSITKEEKEGLQMTDSTGKAVAYLGTDIYYDHDKLNRAFEYINKGISLFPARLDMRFGKCYLLQQLGEYNAFTSELINTIKYSVEIKNNWLWSNHQKQDNGEAFFLNTMQTYLKQLYDTGQDSLLKNMQQIGSVAIQYYPNTVEILSTTAVAYMLTGEYDTAIDYLKKAEAINPKDFIVLNNIAHGYRLKGDKTNAIKYYELTEKYGDIDAKTQARKNLAGLRKQ